MRFMLITSPIVSQNNRLAVGDILPVILNGTKIATLFTSWCKITIIIIVISLRQNSFLDESKLWGAGLLELKPKTVLIALSTAQKVEIN